MSSTRDLVTELKAELRRSGITYAQLAGHLGLAESSVKRILARGDMPLGRIDEILAVLKLDFTELARRVVDRRPPRAMLDDEQERALVADPRLLTVALSALSQWTFDQIVHHYRLEPSQVVAAWAPTCMAAGQSFPQASLPSSWPTTGRRANDGCPSACQQPWSLAVSLAR